MAAPAKVEELPEADQQYLSDVYKRQVGGVGFRVRCCRRCAAAADFFLCQMHSAGSARPKQTNTSPPSNPPPNSPPPNQKVLEHMSVSQLIDIILINPTVHLTPSFRDTGLTASYTFQPLSNLVYTRDQQVRLVVCVVLY